MKKKIKRAPGGGRKPLPAGEARIPLSTKIHPKTEAYLNALQSHYSAFLSKTMSKGELIDKLAHDAMDRLKSTF